MGIFRSIFKGGRLFTDPKETSPRWLNDSYSDIESGSQLENEVVAYKPLTKISAT